MVDRGLIDWPRSRDNSRNRHSGIQGRLSVSKPRDRFIEGNSSGVASIFNAGRDSTEIGLRAAFQEIKEFGDFFPVMMWLVREAKVRVQSAQSKSSGKGFSASWGVKY